jgi:hypothetical protein
MGGSRGVKNTGKLVIVVGIVVVLMLTTMPSSGAPSSVAHPVAALLAGTATHPAALARPTTNLTRTDAPGSSAAGPVIPQPAGATVVVPIYNAYVSHTTTSTVVNNSVQFPVGSFSRVTVTYFDTFISNVFDTSFIVEVNGTQILAGNTLELENTSVTQNITDYYSLVQGNTSVLASCPQFNPGYASYLSVWFTFYSGAAAPHPSHVLSALSSVGFPTPGNAFPVNVPIPFNVSRFTNVTFPSHVSSAYMNFYAQQNGNDEFWYTLQPPFREFRILINDTLVATVQPYPNIQTGGGDLFLWQPILAIGAEVYPPHVLSLTPYLSLLHGTQQVQVQVINDENLWIRVALNFMVNTTAAPVSASSAPTSFTFTNEYTQSPATNMTTKSIPSTANYLNDSQATTETLAAQGSWQNATLSVVSSSVQTVSFVSTSTIFDPNFDQTISTPLGPAIYYYQAFSLQEHIRSNQATTYRDLTTGAQWTVFQNVSQFYEVIGTDVFAIYLAVPLVQVGFTVMQVQSTTSGVLEMVAGSSSPVLAMTDTTSVAVFGSGEFVGTLNSHNVLTSLLFNEAVTTKTVSVTDVMNGVTTQYTLSEMAINNSLVNRNGVLT